MSSSAEAVTARVTKPLSSAIILGAVIRGVLILGALGAHPETGLSVPGADLKHEEETRRVG